MLRDLHLAMPTIPPSLVSLVQEALLRAINRKTTFRTFLVTCGVSENAFSNWAPNETKRVLLDRIMPRLVKHDRGPEVVWRMAHTLGAMSDFPDLKGYEDSPKRVEEARDAVSALAKFIAAQEKIAEDANRKKEAREVAQKLREAEIERKGTLEKFDHKLKELVREQGTSPGGYAFQDWFYDLMAFLEVDHRRPYKAQDRQIDGSVTIEGTTYLVELKFTGGPSDGPDIDVFSRKVGRKADNTMGLFISMADFTSVAKKEASRERSTVLLMAAPHVFLVLNGSWGFEELVARIRRHASQSGDAYLDALSLS